MKIVFHKLWQKVINSSHLIQIAVIVILRIQRVLVALRDCNLLVEVGTFMKLIIGVIVVFKMKPNS